VTRPAPAGTIRIVEPPAGEATVSAAPLCPECGRGFALQWMEETFASGRKVIAPRIAEGVLVRGVRTHRSCAPTDEVTW
jgi:hypothetical protein